MAGAYATNILKVRAERLRRLGACEIIGKYERDEIKPSIDTASKIADALGVILDYLVKDAEYEQIDNDTLKRLKEVQGLDAENRSHVFATIDAFIKAAKLKSIAAM